MSEATAPMKVIDAIYQRRSVRSYSAQKLEPATIRALLKAAVWAPTALHECTAIAPIIVGVPSGHAPTSHRKEAEVLCWI